MLRTVKEVLVRLMTTNQIARRAGLTPERIRQLADAGKISVYALAGRERLFDVDAAENFLRGRR